MLEGRPPLPKLTRRQKAEKYEERAMALKRRLAALTESGGRQGKDLHEALICVHAWPKDSPMHSATIVGCGTDCRYRRDCSNGHAFRKDKCATCPTHICQNPNRCRLEMKVDIT
jgi:hypothetical protein